MAVCVCFICRLYCLAAFAADPGILGQPISQVGEEEILTSKLLPKSFG
jgi:hypothetical protein